MTISREVEEEGFDRAGGLEDEGACDFGPDRIAGGELHVADLDVATNQLEPKSPARPQLMGNRAGAGGLHAIHIRVLADVRRALATVVRDDEHLGRLELFRRGRPFRVTRLEIRAVRHDPDLNEMEAFGLRGIDLAVLDAAARAHDLNLARLELRMITHAVLMLDGTFEDVRKNLHILMAMRREAHAGSHQVLIDDPQ